MSKNTTKTIKSYQVNMTIGNVHSVRWFKNDRCASMWIASQLTNNAETLWMFSLKRVKCPIWLVEK